jgi:HTH-type transcriptional regulator, sugar sensing transcriptional regulator
MITQKQLINLGFNSKEAGVYLALMELGPSTAAEIARKAKINRTTGYDILESLAGDGLVFLTGEAKIKKYAAESPEKVIKFLENKIRKITEQIGEAQNLLPQLLSIYNAKEKPKVKFFSGGEGMKEAMEDTLTAQGEILAYAIGDDVLQALSEEYVKDYFKKRVAKNISIRAIGPDTEEDRAIILNDKQELRTSLLVPKDKFYFSTETDIYNNKILIASWREKFAVIIESNEIAESQKKVFELAWLGAKTLNLQ